MDFSVSCYLITMLIVHILQLSIQQQKCTANRLLGVHSYQQTLIATKKTILPQVQIHPSLLLFN